LPQFRASEVFVSLFILYNECRPTSENLYHKGHEGTPREASQKLRAKQPKAKPVASL
jgi:hypothetical protein